MGVLAEHESMLEVRWFDLGGDWFGAAHDSSFMWLMFSGVYFQIAARDSATAAD
jgi:hypothetical protein